MGGHYALAPLENHLKVYVLSINICKEVQTKACNILNLAVSRLRHHIKLGMLLVKTP